MLFAGQYRRALEAFNKYNAEHPPDGRGAEWPLKELVAEIVVTELGIDQQERDSGAAQALVREVAEADSAPKEAKQVLSRALDQDALEPLAWFNLGHASSLEGNNAQAASAFRCAAAIAEWDATAWALAFIYSVLGDATPGLVAAVFATGRRLTSGQMVPTTVELIREQDHDETFPKQPLLDALNALDAEIPAERDEGFQIRTLQAGGRVDTIDIPGATERPPSARRASAKVGRNEPCPCGSGKKYKKCHGA